MSTIASPQCPLFQTMLPLIAAGKGQESRLYDQQWQQKVWQEICDDHGPLAQKGPRMSLCRWYGWWDCFDYWLPYLHQRLLVMLYWAISTKVITGDVHSVRMKLSGLTHAHTEKDGKESIEEAKAKQAAVRAKGKNQLHVATLIAMNEAVVRRGKCIYFLLAPMRTAHGEQIKQCHDSESSVAWYCRQAGGAIWEPIEETWQLLEKPGPLGKWDSPARPRRWPSGLWIRVPSRMRTLELVHAPVLFPTSTKMQQVPLFNNSASADPGV